MPHSYTHLQRHSHIWTFGEWADDIFLFRHLQKLFRYSALCMQSWLLAETLYLVTNIFRSDELKRKPKEWVSETNGTYPERSTEEYYLNG